MTVFELRRGEWQLDAGWGWGGGAGREGCPEEKEEKPGVRVLDSGPQVKEISL